MNKLPRYLIVGIAVLGLSASCFAAGESPAPSDGVPQNCQCPASPHEGKSPEGGPSWRSPEVRQQRLQKLHGDLKLSSYQEKAWNDYVAVVDKDKGLRGDRQPCEEFEKLSAPEHLEKMLEGMKRHEARLQERLNATKIFYAKLSSTQKAVFDKEVMMPHYRHGGPYGPRGPRGSRPVDDQQ